MMKNWMLKYMNFWPPFLGSGIKVKNVAPDFTSVDVEVKMRFWNRNYVGSHYGGTIYSMTDPWYMLMLMQNIGKEYIVWDKSAEVRFLKPGYGKLSAHFNLTAERIAARKARLSPKSIKCYTCAVKTAHATTSHPKTPKR